ncbi:unnamed protein product [Adineta ricciae]|uniref:Protease Do-like PDZ domain-containing protein n=1 Tax=Adineta ricciae TaxID=249248 RepID=A0A815GW53_ADIRI|nr:unnamed protein product [Adineta ricciae]
MGSQSSKTASEFLIEGGDNLSVTKGVLSRVCMLTYSHSWEYFLSIQIDAAINPGNSGETACILNKILKKDDVITGIDEKSIADDGTIDFRRGERLRFIHLSKIKFVGDEISFTIIRQGKEMKLTSLLDNNSALVPLHSHDKRPEYLIYGGIVFTVLTLEESDQQIVVINRIICHRCDSQNCQWN